MKNKETLVEIKNINKYIGRGDNKKVILDNVSFSIFEGDWIGIVGGNGAGKTSIVEVVAGLTNPSSGTIEYNFEFKKTFKEGIGIQFQATDFPFALSVRDMIKLAISSRGLKITRKDMKNILEVFGIKGFYHRRANSLSGGQKQRVNILMSVIHKPKLLILDEFSTGLDIESRKQVIAIMNGLKKTTNMSGLVITHHLGEIEALCNKMIVMEEGKAKEMMEVSDVVKKYGSVEKYVSEHVLKGGQNEINF